MLGFTCVFLHVSLAGLDVRLILEISCQCSLQFPKVVLDQRFSGGKRIEIKKVKEFNFSGQLNPLFF